MIDRLKTWWSGTAIVWIRAHPILAAASAAIGGIGSLIYIGGSIISTGVIAGLLVSGAIGVLVYKVGSSENKVLQKVYNVALDHPLTTDVAITAVAFLLAPNGICAWVAASVAGLIASCFILCAAHARDMNQLLTLEREPAPEVVANAFS